MSLHSFTIPTVYSYGLFLCRILCSQDTVQDLVDFFPSLFRLCGIRYDLCIRSGLQGGADQLHLLLYLTAVDLVQLGGNDDGIVAIATDPVIHDPVVL